MKNRKTVLIIFLLSFINCCLAQSNLRRLGYFTRISNSIVQDETLKIEDTLRFSNDCHFGEDYQLEMDFINNNFNAMSNGDKSIIGYRSLKIEFKMYPMLTGTFGGVIGIYCINFSGYAIRKGIKGNSSE